MSENNLCHNGGCPQSSHHYGGTYRVNRTKVELSKAERVEIDLADGRATFSPESLRSVPVFSRLPDVLISRMAGSFKTEEVTLGNNLVVEGAGENKFFIIAQGQVEVLSKGPTAVTCALRF
jgi:hypothetical protein